MEALVTCAIQDKTFSNHKTSKVKLMTFESNI